MLMASVNKPGEFGGHLFETIPSRARAPYVSLEGVTDRSVTGKNNPIHERPGRNAAITPLKVRVVLSLVATSGRSDKKPADNITDYVNATVYGTDDVLARGPNMAVDFITSKLANAAGKMAKLIGTDIFLDGLGTGSSTLSIDGLNQWFDNGSLFTTVGGLTRSDLGVSNGTNSQGANGYVASMSAGFTLRGVQKAFGSAWFGNQHVDLIVSDQNSWDRHLSPAEHANA